MTRTTPPRPVDIAELFPELRDHCATTTRLHPRPGTPGVGDSSIGGPPRWPAGEPWPYCTDGDHDDDKDMLTTLAPVDQPIPMILVAQLYRRDVPGFIGPDDHDLMQVLWCPLDHTEHDYQPRVHVVWRRSADVTEALDTIPEPPVANEAYLPRPCALHPEQVVEYQFQDLLPDDLRSRIDEWDSGSPSYFFDLSLAPGWKLGGFPDWSVSGPRKVSCATCGSEMAFLLAAASGEWANEGQSWRPRDDPPDTDIDPAGVVLGRAEDLNLFYCPASFDHPVAAAGQ
ncbi:hypothetical protein [Actinoplanes sp. G11-F43]|uniref:hypothetical protein n=1 Tax=Actinoplanes sp. G11-F43 TaxID=3424130 RepID=UPI003D340BCB